VNYGWRRLLFVIGDASVLLDDERKKGTLLDSRAYYEDGELVCWRRQQLHG